MDLFRSDAGDGGDEALGVGFLGVEENLFSGAAFDNLALEHHDDVVGDVLDDADVVGDEEVGEVVFVLELHEEVEDLGADGEVEGGDGLVADDHLGLEGDGAGDADALALAAGEGVGVAEHRVGLEADVAEELGGGVLGLFGGDEAVDEHALGEDVEDGVAGVEGGVGVLEDDLEVAAVLEEVFALELEDVAPHEADGAAVGLFEAEDGAAEGALAAAGLADHAEGLAGVHGEGDAVDGFDVAGGAREDALFDGEPGAQIRHLDEGLGGALRGGAARRDGGGDGRLEGDDARVFRVEGVGLLQGHGALLARVTSGSWGLPW